MRGAKLFMLQPPSWSFPQRVFRRPKSDEEFVCTLSVLVCFHPHAGADRVAVAEDVVHAGHGRPGFVVVQALRAQAASTRVQRISSSRKDSIRSCGNGGDGDGFVHVVEDFDGVALAAVARDMVVNELDDVAAFEPVLAHVAGQNSVFVWLEFQAAAVANGRT